MTEFTTVPIGQFGAVVEQIDLRDAISESTAQQLRDALAKFQLLHFRDTSIGPADQLRLTRCFGSLDPGISRRPPSHQVNGYPDLLLLRNSSDSPTTNYGMAWHSDGLAYARRPHGATVLHCLQCPSDPAGDTLFADQYGAYESLPVELRSSLEGMHWRLPPIDYSEVPEGRSLIRPIVRVHPVTGRQFVYCSPQATSIRGLSDAQSDEILSAVHAAQTAEDLVYRHSWRPGDVVVWENATLLHNRAGVLDFSRQGLREMHRSATVGDFEATECEPVDTLER
ncbi:TauD/TfdA family dioxygenase [Myceligenerans halotolerans]